MKIALESSPLLSSSPSGITRYSSNLIQGLYNIGEEAELYFPISRIAKKKNLEERFKSHQRWYFDNIKLPWHKSDVFHMLDLRSPNWKHPNKLVTVHDIFIHITNNQKISPRQFQQKKKQELINSFSDCSKLISVSETTKSDLIEHFNIDEKRIYVAPLGLEKRFFEQAMTAKNDVIKKYNLPSEYILFVGAISERKNCVNMLQAYANSELNGKIPFVFAGDLSYNSEFFLSEIKRLKIEKSILVTGFIDEEDLIPLYDFASAFIFPTRYEGFGIPLLEAMSRSCPILTSSVGAAKEVCQEHAIYTHPEDMDEMTSAFNQILNGTIDLDLAKKHCLSYTWEETARLTKKAYLT